MNRSKRSEQNRSYYQKNRERILAKAKTRGRKSEQSNVIQLFENSAQEEFKFEPVEPPKEPKRNEKKAAAFLSLALKVLLVLGITYFLVSESTKFYLSQEEGFLNALLKAMLLEGSAIAFSLMFSKSGFVRIIYKALVVCIYAYVVWVLSGSLFQKAVLAHAEVKNKSELVHNLEGQINAKQALKEQLLKLGRVTQARIQETILDQLQEKLFSLRESLSHSFSEKAIWNNFFILLTFRVLMMISNFLCLQQLGRELKVLKRSF